MADFIVFKEAVQKQFDKLSSKDLYETDVSKDKLWDTYLSSFPEGSNPIYLEKSEHDCNCCKQFIRACGSTVGIVNNDNKYELVTIWDIDVPEPYKSVAKALSNLVKNANIKDRFLHEEKTLGTNFNHQELEDGGIKRWDHFYYKLPKRFVQQNSGIILSTARSNYEVLFRSFQEITLESANTVLELIEQKSIYRGEEYKSIVSLFIKNKKLFDKTVNRDYFCWELSMKLGEVSKIRNTVIGTLLIDISENMALDNAVKRFETKVAPMNYKRPTAIATKSMIESAQKEVEKLGISGSLYRRHSTKDDITINNILFANRDIKKSLNVFDELKEQAPVKIGNLSKVEEVDIDIFVKDILPKAESIELLFEDKHKANLFSLISPINKDSKPIFKWDNNFSWSYNGNVTDSIKEKIKKAGGNVNGILRASLSWFNSDDLDIHCTEPNRNHIYFSKKRSNTSGFLDIDMNAGGERSREAVENIVWTDKKKMLEGRYEIYINNYCKRENEDIGFDCEIEFDGKIHTFSYDKVVGNKVVVAILDYSHKDGIKIIESLPSKAITKNYWGINTNTFHKVSMVMNSPNHWENNTGNKHLFFVIDKCLNDESARGFYNEFLNEELSKHRKVFEILGNKMKVEDSKDQLSGLGFSYNNSVYCKVIGSFSRTIKIVF